MTEFDPVTDMMGGQSYSTGGSAMNQKSDERVLAEAMGKCWHEYPAVNFPFETGKAVRTCSVCGSTDLSRPTFTQSAELWELLMYMVGREDWHLFCVETKWNEWKSAEWPSNFFTWLLTETYVDENGQTRLLFVRLCADWCREHTEKGECK
jgi:hypothetical protein